MQYKLRRESFASLIIALAGLFAFVTIVIADTATTSVTVGNATPSLSVTFNGGNAITLTESTFAYASATLTITDGNGCNTINFVTATAFLASTSALAGTPCAENDNNCYPTSSTTASGIPAALSDTLCLATTTGNQCTGGGDTSVQYDCGFKLWFIAEATAAGSPTWASSIWAVAATTSDGTATTTASNTTQNVEINSLAATAVDATLSFGTLSANTNTGATNSTTTATTTGNIAIDVALSGTNMTGAGTIDVSRQKYSTSPFTYSSAGTHLTNTTTPTVELASGEPTATTSLPASAISWGIAIDAGQANGAYTGTDTFTAQAD
ncbi:MAG: hypothetical protein AAB590_02725 [Patescibacteria group bacterium]